MTDCMSIDGVELPCPATYKVIPQPIYSDETKRNVEALLVVDYIATKRQIMATWNIISPEEFRTIQDRTKDPDGIIVSFYNPLTDQVESGEFLRDTSFDYTLYGPWEDKKFTIDSFTLTEM